MDELRTHLICSLKHRMTKKKLPTSGKKLNHSSTSTAKPKRINYFLTKYVELLREQRFERTKKLVNAEWDPMLKEAKITKVAGNFLNVIGHMRNSLIYVYPEEALYLMEMNRLQLTFNGIVLSMQQSYEILTTCDPDLTLNEYRVYKHLSQHGYRLFRSTEKNLISGNSMIKETNINSTPEIKDSTLDSGTFLKHESESEKNSLTSETTKHQKYSEIFKKLQIFKSISSDTCANITRANYDVYLPGVRLSKTSRSRPNYRLIILRSDADINLSNIPQYHDSCPLIFAKVSKDSISFSQISSVVLPNIY